MANQLTRVIPPSKIPAILLDEQARREACSPEESIEEFTLSSLVEEVGKMKSYSDLMHKQGDNRKISSNDLDSKSNITYRSIQAHKVLLERVDTKIKRRRYDHAVSNVLSEVISFAEQAMLEAQVAPEIREVILQNLMLKIEQEEIEDKLIRRLGATNN